MAPEALNGEPLPRLVPIDPRGEDQVLQSFMTPGSNTSPGPLTRHAGSALRWVDLIPKRFTASEYDWGY